VFRWRISIRQEGTLTLARGSQGRGNRKRSRDRTSTSTIESRPYWRGGACLCARDGPASQSNMPGDRTNTLEHKRTTERRPEGQ